MSYFSPVSRLILLPLAVAVAAGCSTPASKETPGVISNVPQEQMDFVLSSGTYRCEEGISVDVQRDTGAAGQVQLAWKGERYRLLRNLSYSGLPRYEDEASGLVWIDLPWKSVLLDGRSGKPLASECRGTASAKRG